MNSTAFSLLANSSSELDRSQEMELTIGSLSIIVGPSGSSRLSDSTKPDPSANKPEIEETLESSEGSSSEANSLVNFDKIQKKFDSEKFRLRRNSVSDAQQRKELHRWEEAASTRYISYASLSLKQKKKTIAKGIRMSTCKSTK
jgi:hypothetical protein